MPFSQASAGPKNPAQVTISSGSEGFLKLADAVSLQRLKNKSRHF
jgi:hypothetical protein